LKPGAAAPPAAASPPERKETPRVGTVRAQLPVVPMPEQISDEEPTILRASPFGEIDETPPPRAPLPTPVRDLLARGQGEQPSGPRAAPERKFPSPPPSPPHPPAPPEPPAPRTDTFRATPEAKRSWFPEPDSEPPSLPSAAVAPAPPPAPSSPFPVGAPRAVPPSIPLGAPIPSGAYNPPVASGPFAAPVASGPFAMPNAAVPTSAVGFDEVQALRGQKKKTVLIVVVVAVVLAVGVLAMLLSGGSEKPPPPAPAPEPHAATPSPTSEAAPTTVSAANPSPTSEPAPETGKAARGGGELPGAPGPNPNTPGGFAEMFAQGAKQAGSPGATGHFDAGAAKSALDALLTEAARCREPGGPQGIARVAVTFAPNGGVSSATIAEPPFAGTSVGNCMCEAMKRARIKPFTGPPGTLTERISIR
jgi:hypothetical protein